MPGRKPSWSPPASKVDDFDRAWLYDQERRAWQWENFWITAITRERQFAGAASRNVLSEGGVELVEVESGAGYGPLFKYVDDLLKLRGRAGEHYWPVYRVTYNLWKGHEWLAQNSEIDVPAPSLETAAITAHTFITDKQGGYVVLRALKHVAFAPQSREARLQEKTRAATEQQRRARSRT